LSGYSAWLSSPPTPNNRVQWSALKGFQLYIITIQHVVCFRCARRAAPCTLLVFRFAISRVHIIFTAAQSREPVPSRPVVAAAAARYTRWRSYNTYIYIYIYTRSREPAGVLWLPLARARWNIVSYTRSNGCKWNINSPRLIPLLLPLHSPALQYYIRLYHHPPPQPTMQPPPPATSAITTPHSRRYIKSLYFPPSQPFACPSSHCTAHPETGFRCMYT